MRKLHFFNRIRFSRISSIHAPSRSYSTRTEGVETETSKSSFAWLAGFAGFSIGMIYYLGKPEMKQHETKERQLVTASEDGVLEYPKRAFRKIRGVFQTFKEPAFEKLLPDQINDPAHPRPYTLVIDLDKFLICHMWDPQQSRWRIAKRPGTELFLFYAAQLFEVVVFSSLPQHEGDAVVKKLDPFGCISHSLFRFATTHTSSGAYLKDIGRLNRDLSKVIVLGHDETGFSVHPENFIKMKEWTGDAVDHTLEESIDFLETVAFSRLDDLRPAIKYQQGKIFPDSFEKEQEAAFESAREKNLLRIQGRNSNFLFRIFGLAKSASVLEKENQSYRERRNERIEARRREFEHLKDLMMKQMEAEMEKERAFYKEHKMALWDLFSKNPQPQPPSPQN